MGSLATVSRVTEITGADAVMELRRQMRRWAAAGLVVTKVQARGRYKVGPAELEIPSWADVVDYGHKRIRIDGVPAALPTHATAGSQLRVTVTCSGQLVSEPGTNDESPSS